MISGRRRPRENENIKAVIIRITPSPDNTISAPCLSPVSKKDIVLHILF